MTYDDVLLGFERVAQAAYPEEACALIYIFKGRAKLHVCHNLAPNRYSDFVIGPEDYFEAEEMGEVVGVVHSHPDGTHEFSEADRIAHANSELAWWVVSINPGKPHAWSHLPAVGKLPLIGRIFKHGVVDCFTLIRDYYKQVRSVRLPDFDRVDEWWNKGYNLYVDNYEKAGFRKLAESEHIQVGDVLLMNIASDTINHGAIYIGNNEIMHHLYGRISCKEVYTGYYRDRTGLRLRFESN